MNTLVVKYDDVTTFKILGAAEELLEVVVLLSQTSIRVEFGFKLGLTILAKRTKKTSFVFDEIKDVLFGEIQDFVKRQTNTDCAEFDKWSKSNFNTNFDEVAIEEWADRLDRFSK
jgi:hypothetical protein